MIPGLAYAQILAPLRLDAEPLIDPDQWISQFDLDCPDNQVQHLAESVLKPQILSMLAARGLTVEKLDLWNWNLARESRARPHSDGYSNLLGRRAGINWLIRASSSWVSFYDPKQGQPIREQVPDGRTHTLWQFDHGVKPLITWNNQYPSLINPQIPHLVHGPDQRRISATIKFQGNPSWVTVARSLRDLRLDLDPQWLENHDFGNLG